MRILIDIGHPGHVHLFRPFAQIVLSKNHCVLFTCREKEFEIELLSSAGFKFKSFGKKYKKLVGKLFGLIKFDLMEIATAIRFNPDIFISHGSPYASHAAWLIGKPHISLEDTGNAEQVKLYLPFTKHVLTSTSFHKNYGTKQIRYSGFHELAYLHPNRFLPDDSILKELGLSKSDTYFFLRFVSWNASHDRGQNGINFDDKVSLINHLKSLGKVFISSEQELPDNLKKYQIKLHPSKVHHAMYYAHLFIGEGATMASECAVMGTTAIYVNSMEAGTIDEQEKYGLVYHLKNGEEVLALTKKLLAIPDLKTKAKENAAKLINDKIDVTAFLVWFIENYPESVQTMKTNPDYQYRFK